VLSRVSRLLRSVTSCDIVWLPFAISAVRVRIRAHQRAS
jgi:hypothetical protein